MLASQTFGTSIIVARSDSEIAVAADSLDLWGDSNIPKRGCKILQFGNYFFAFAGVSLPVGFDIPKIAEDAFRNAPHIKDAANSFESKIGTILPETLRRIARDYPVSFRQIATSHEIISAVFFGFEEGTAELHLREFMLGDATTLNLRLGSADYIKGSPLAYLMLGASTVANEFVEKNPAFLKQNNLADNVLHLVEMEIVDQPKFVGPPVDVLRVTKDGAEWIQHKKECPDIQSDTPKSALKPTRRKRRRD
jgi:hypothetical protein